MEIGIILNGICPFVFVYYKIHRHYLKQLGFQNCLVNKNQFQKVQLTTFFRRAEVEVAED